MRGLLLVLAACGDSSSNPGLDGSLPGDGADGGGLVSLEPTPTTYRETCDGSGALALSFTHFVDLNDENQGARVYQRAMATAPVQTIDLSTGLGLAANVE